MPPRFTVGKSYSAYSNEKKASSNSIAVKRSSNAINRDFETHRAYEVARAAGACGLGGRAFICVSAGKGNNVRTYV